MRHLIALVAMLAICACSSKPVKVPTVEEFMANPAMLSEWSKKCQSGEYSNLPLEESVRLCSSANSAAMAMTQKALSEQSLRFLSENTPK